MLPPVYQPVFDELFDRPKPDETRATCENCAMCDHGEPSPVAMEYFNSDTKCCTYFPQLPNYLVGAILADESPEMAEGKRRIRERIKTRIGVTPHWLTRPQKMTLIMLGYAPAFGRAKTLLCPYYDATNPAGTCSIWRHRETICMTYYCKYVGGQRGYDFWTALKGYLSHVQRHLVRHAQAAVDPKCIEPIFKKNQLSTEDIDDLAPKESAYKNWWGPWVGREEEFYLKCHEWMMAMKPSEFQLNVDQSDEGKHYVKELRTAYEKLENKILPKSLVRNARMKEDHVEGKVVVTTYHRYDSFSLDKDLYDVVGLFKASESLEENLARLKKDDGIELAPELIEYLFAAGVLVEPTPLKVADAKADNAGELSGRRVALEAILEARKIETTISAKRRIAAADSATLDDWIKKAATATNLVDVMGVEPVEKGPDPGVDPPLTEKEEA
jgi:hypothetical protein